MQNRYLHNLIQKDLHEKMVFLAGPRQVGKTVLAKLIGETDYKNFQYLNWDDRKDRESILSEKWDPEAKLLIFDEIHKFKSWKNSLKGIYDKNQDLFHILVTGSARLDMYRKSGDSLLGRYHLYRLHPFSLGEVLNEKPALSVPFEPMHFKSPSAETNELLNTLLHFGGFPEPFIKQDEKTLRRWQNSRMDRLIKEDIRDATLLRDMSALQIMVDLLPSKVGSLFSINSLQEDLHVTHRTLTLWTTVLEQFYYHYRIYPFSSSIIKSLRKEPKLYLWDWSEVKDEGAQFENMVAGHLLKFCHLLRDAEGYKAELNYLRDVDGREVDFLVSIDKKPWFAVEVKISDKNPSKFLNYFGEKLGIPSLYQVVKTENVDILENSVRVISADKFLSALP